MMERAFSKAIFTVLGPGGSGSESGCCDGVSGTILLKFALLMLGWTFVAGGLREIKTGI